MAGTTVHCIVWKEMIVAPQSLMESRARSCSHHLPPQSLTFSAAAKTQNFTPGFGTLRWLVWRCWKEANADKWTLWSIEMTIRSLLELIVLKSVCASCEPLWTMFEWNLVFCFVLGFLNLFCSAGLSSQLFQFYSALGCLMAVWWPTSNWGRLS